MLRKDQIDESIAKNPSNMRYADCCAYCQYGNADNVCSLHHVLINLYGSLQYAMIL
jgi:hypothetical protein